VSRRIAVTLQKGGVGKSTVTVNLAAALAACEGLRVAVVDMDSQRNATTHLLGDRFDGPTLYNVLQGEAELGAALTPCHHPNLWALAGARELVAFERGSDDPRRARTILGVRDVLEAAMPPEIDVVLIDTPPGGGIWLQAALAAAHGFLIVAWPDGFSANGLLELFQTADAVKEAYNPDLVPIGLVINHVRNTTGHRGYAEVFQEIYPDLVLQPLLPVRSAISDARDALLPVEFFERRYRVSNPAAPLFRQLAAQLVTRMQRAGALAAR
jgi:chromosome partitioning protein